MSSLRRGLTAVILTVTAAWAGTLGTFRGVIAQLPPDPEIIFVRAPDGSHRRVDKSRANVRYAPSVDEKGKPAAKALVPGAEVRVTAEQDATGVWRAEEVEILKLAPRMQ